MPRAQQRDDPEQHVIRQGKRKKESKWNKGGMHHLPVPPKTNPWNPRRRSSQVASLARVAGEVTPRWQAATAGHLPGP